jgi:hypothetical protein
MSANMSINIDCVNIEKRFSVISSVDVQTIRPAKWSCTWRKLHATCPTATAIITAMYKCVNIQAITCNIEMMKRN